jgi:hypothetical protein
VRRQCFSGLSAANDIYQTREISKAAPLTGLVQGTQVVVFIIAGLVALGGLGGAVLWRRRLR